MKIDLKLTSDEILYLDDKTTLTMSIRWTQLPKDKRNAYSIMLDVLDKVSSKAKTIKRNQSLFDAKKKHKLSLKWHEADYLEQYIDVFYSYQEDAYSQNMARKIIAQLNQKLV